MVLWMMSPTAEAESTVFAETDYRLVAERMADILVNDPKALAYSYEVDDGGEVTIDAEAATVYIPRIAAVQAWTHSNSRISYEDSSVDPPRVFSWSATVKDFNTENFDGERSWAFDIKMPLEAPTGWRRVGTAKRAVTIVGKDDIYRHQGELRLNLYEKVFQPHYTGILKSSIHCSDEGDTNLDKTLKVYLNENGDYQVYLHSSTIVYHEDPTDEQKENDPGRSYGRVSVYYSTLDGPHWYDDFTEDSPKAILNFDNGANSQKFLAFKFDDNICGDNRGTILISISKCGGDTICR